MEYKLLKEVAGKNNGYIFTSQFDENNITKYMINNALKDNVIKRVCNGIYMLYDGIEDNLFLFQQRNKNIVYSHETAAYLLGYTTRDPLIYNVSTHSNDNLSNAIKFIEFKISYQSKDKLDLGKTNVTTIYGNDIVVYEIERVICEMFTNNYKGDVFVRSEVLKNYIKSDNKDLIKLTKYAKLLNVEKELFARLEVLL